MGNVFFVDGPGGSGKTFLYSAILAKIKASRLLALSTATSGIAALLLESGQTLHSTFKIPIPVTHVSTCGFSPDSMIGLQIQAVSIIIVDEAPMMHRHVFETLDRSIRDVMKTTNRYLENVPFGGKVVVMGGDFRQMLPVIQKGSRAMIINSALNRNQRAWSEFLLAVAEGRAGTDVCLPNEIRRVSSLTDLISQVYGSFDDDETQLLTKTILTPLNDDVVELNNMVTRGYDMIPSSLTCNQSNKQTQEQSDNYREAHRCGISYATTMARQVSIDLSFPVIARSARDFVRCSSFVNR
ncbi:uncharacterized protein LOC144701417 [Wolffia australiana]